jgi:geranylgeranyl diphosphate synthase, type II
MTKLPLVKLAPAVPLQRERPAQANIPDARGERERLKALVTRYVEGAALTTPLSFEELRGHTATLSAEHGLDERYTDYVAVLMNNVAWREQLASVPYERRLLLLPKCLRVEDKCPAPFDEFGLLCKSCGLCSIQDLQEEAERLGYACLVAEGSALVMALIESGQIEAIVGVSCLSVLEKAFPYTEAAAIPCLAIPLLQDDCKDTTVDLEWVWDAIHLSSEDQSRRLDLDGLRGEIDGWFSEANLARLLDDEGDSGETGAVGRRWLGQAGKRWRPFLAACTYAALQGDPSAALPEDIQRLAIAVECFHKASLIHDDIEDEDQTRYGEDTLHVSHGLAVALNVGDYLIGEGYRLIAECEAAPALKSRMLKIAARGHRTLCLGQGAELCWARDPAPMKVLEVLDIFRRKTAPAFEVALQLGALLGGADDALLELLASYSDSLGIAYQIRDDIEDLAAEHGDAPDDVSALRPTLPLAIAWERARKADKAIVERAWRRDPALAADPSPLREVMETREVEPRARDLLERYKEQAIRGLVEVENPSLKGLLRRVVGKIFSLEIKGWCDEFERQNLPQAVTEKVAEAVVSDAS